MLKTLLLAGVLAFLSNAAYATTAVQVWQQRWSGITAAIGPTPVAARELTDGTSMIIGGYTGSLVAIRYDHGGSLLSTAQFSSPYFSLYTFLPPNVSQASLVAIDPFGGVFVAAESDLTSTRGDTWLMKYDGLTGKELWAAPAIFDGPSHQQDTPARLLIDSRGDVLLVSLSHNFGSFDTVVLKYAGVSGNLVWGPAKIASTGFPYAVLDPSGNVIAAVSRRPTGNYVDIETYKLDGQTGNLQWGPSQFGGVTHDDTVGALAVGPDGSAIVSGSSLNGIETLKYDGVTGGQIWGPSVYAESTFPAPVPTDVSVDPIGDLVLSGTAGDHFLVLKYAGGTGAPIWGPQTATKNSGVPLTVRLAGNGDVVASGWDQSDGLKTWRYRGGTGSPVWGPLTFPGAVIDTARRPLTFVASNARILSAVSTASGLSTLERDPETGTPVWGPTAFTAAFASKSRVTDVTQGPDGSVLVTGYTSSATAGFVTFKYARSSGTVLWGPVFYDIAPASFGYPFTVRTDASGDVFVLGVADGLVLLKYSGATGALLWGPAKYANLQPAGLAIDSAGNVFALAQIYNGSDLDFVTLKFSGATGSTLWGPVTFNRGPGRNDWPTAIAVTPGGDFVVSGTSMTNSPPAEWITLKYSGATGSVLWGPVVFGQSGADGDSVRDLAVDTSGNLLIVGKGFNGSNDDMVTMKYDGTTGAVLWGPKLIAGTGDYYDGAYAVALDFNGDVFVGGDVYQNHSPSPPDSNYDFATIKYRGSDGAVLWGPQIFNGPANDYDAAYALVLDSAGNPVVAGVSRNAEHNTDIAILKYDGTTGAPLWGPILAGGVGEDELPIHNLVVRGKSVVIAGTSAGQFFTVAYDEIFGIRTLPEEISPAYCGQAFAKALVAGNVTGTVTWSVVSGALPAGLSLDASNGGISGAPTAVGSFAFRIRAQDSTGPTAERDFVIEVFEGSAFVPILATANPVCPGQSTTFSVSGSWASYHWLPGGEISASVTVSPTETTDYGVILTDAIGCHARGYGRVLVGPHVVPIQVPAPVCAGGTGNAASVADAGPGATYSWVLTNGTITSGAGTSSINFTAGTFGFLQLTVTVTDAGGCSETGTRAIAVAECRKSFYTVTPCRVIDTRNPSGPLGGPALAGGATRTFAIANQCGIPADAASVSVNVTITNPTALGHLVLYPAGIAPPLVSTINYRAGQTRANNAILPLGAAGDFVVSCAGSGTVDFILDVNGYFQ